MNFTSNNGIRGSGFKNLILTNINVKSQDITADNLDGGLFLTDFHQVHILGGSYLDINNTADEGSTDHSPAMKFVDSSFIWINNVSITNAGVGINSYNSEHMYAAGVKMEGINNNGYYIQSGSTDIDISGGYVRNFKDAGVVCKINSNYSANEYETSLRVRGVEFNNTDDYINANPLAAMRGIGLRQGSGLLVSGCLFINCGTAMSQTSDFSGCSYVKFHDNIIVNPRGSAAISVDDGDRYDIHHNTISYVGAIRTNTLSSLTSSSTTATGITSIAHNLLSGDTVTISGAVEAGYNVVNAVITKINSTTFTYTVPSGLSSPATGTITATYIASYSLRFNTVTNSIITDNKIYASNNAITGLSINDSDSILIRDNIITGVVSKYQNVSNSSTNIIQEQDGTVLGQYAAYAGPSSSVISSAPSIAVKSTNASVAQNDYIGVYNFYSADTSGSGAGVHASLGVKASNSTASQHQYDFSIDGTLVTTIDHNGNVKALVGDVEVVTIGKGVIIASPNGTRFKITVTNAGVLTITAV